MADRDWKKRVGIEINFSSDSSEDERSPEKCGFEKGENAPLSPKLPDSSECSLEALHLTEDEFFNQMIDEYGTTPPRTRIRRKERRHREKEVQSVGKKSPKVFYTSRVKRRNTLDSIYFDGLLEKSESTDVTHTDEDQYLLESNRRTKRSMKLLRGSERDMKLEQVNIRHSMPPMSEQSDERTESMPAMAPQCAIKIESSNRFMSLTSKPVACREKLRKAREREEFCCGQENKLELFNKVTHLIRTGCCDKSVDKHNWRQLSVEEHGWQNELQDLIWLELQAWHADRTLTEQDEYLCKAREGAASLLDEIMNYRFKPLPSTSCNFMPAPLSAQSSDSGMSCEGHEDAQSDIISAEAESKTCPCVGCLSIYCGNCLENQLYALKDVQQMLNRLEAAEALYPSSTAFGLHYPLYKSPEFIGRVKSMCLWYNMTKHHCLKLRILGKHLTSSFSRNYNWPTWGDDDLGVATDTSASTEDPPNCSREATFKRSFSKFRKRVVQFDTESVGSSPSDSNNSNASQVSSDAGVDMADYGECSEIQNFPINSSANPFRKYIEDVLKTRGIRKALHFLERLHKHLLLKSMISLSEPSQKQDFESLDVNANDSVDTIQKSTEELEKLTTDPVQDGQLEDIHKYGYWSKDAQALHLPSYRATFLFLAHIPLDVIFELLKMRLEQKPENPSVLCIRQLMRELKEGLRMAALYRERYCHLIRTVLWNVDEVTLQKFLDVSDFDQTCAAVLQLYLHYLQQWVPMVQHERFHKNLLEEEWQFAKLTCVTIPGAICSVGSIFCNIACGMLEAISSHLSTRMKEVMKHKDTEVSDEESSTRYLVMSVCREFQTLFNEAREKTVKAVGFAKNIIKDLEKEEFIQFLQEDTYLILTNALEELKRETLILRQDIVSNIETIQTICSKWKMGEHDEGETIAMTSRCREVLHLSYKYSFEFHKEILRVVTGESKLKLCQGYISFCYQWMKFVDEWCERGRGHKPRWAYQGLDFLSFVCDPVHTCHLSEEEFDNFQHAAEKCLTYVIGTASPVSEKRVSSPYIYHGGRGSLDGQRPRSRASSPASRTRSPGYRASKSLTETTTPPASMPQKSLTVPDIEINGDVSDGFSPAERNSRKVSRIERVRSAIKQLENLIDNKLLNQELIGSVTVVGSEDKIHIRSRSVTFSWQRGMKIGQGRFGKVYTAVNNQSGELLAMKEIQLQPNDHRTIRRVAEELRIFEGINHRSLVRYYGVEIHREEMLIFMEFCAEGTLESLVAATESGLPETLMRRYTHQLLEAVATLHWHGVVHRDIKSANIFLTDEGNSLKLGDFGCAVKIKAHTTMPGELQGFVGTQAYMAPEVFMKTNADGHGRAADIWSVGCVVVEMASGKRPWAEYDSNYQIMFKVGMGEAPDVPASLSEEGQNFVNLCLHHDPRLRAIANDLLLHSFVKVDGDEDYLSTHLSGSLDDYLKIVSGH